MKKFRRSIAIAGVIIATVCFFAFSGSSPSSRKKDFSKRWNLKIDTLVAAAKEKDLLKRWDVKVDTLIAVNPAAAGERQLAFLGE